MEDFSAILATRRAPDPEHHARPLIWALILGVLLLMAVAVSALGPEAPAQASPTLSATPSRESRIYTVTYRFGVFSPTNLRVHVGDTVRFRNDSSGAIRIIADVLPGKRVPEFDSVGPVQPDGYFSYTFATAGGFGYHNEADPNQAGVVIVRE
jgi:plastocyanin